MKQTKKILAILIAVCLCFTALLVPASATETAKSVILNEGNDIGLIAPQHDLNGQVSVEVVEGESPYGPAYAMTATAAGWNNFKTGFVMPVGDNDVSGMEGFAFYVKAPQDAELEGVNPLLDMFFFHTNAVCSHKFINDESIYYVPTGSTEVEEVIFGGGDYPIANKPFYEGFVFVPFTTLGRTWGDGIGITSENLTDYDRYELRINIANTADALLGKSYIIDEVGFYTDPLAYVEYVEEQSANRNYAEPIELVANDGTNARYWSDQSKVLSLTQTTTANTGLAYNLYSGLPYEDGLNTANCYWAHFDMPKGDNDVSATSGIAFYVEIPDDLDNCRMQIRLHVNDYEKFYNDPIVNKMYYVEAGSTTVEEQTIQPGYYPFEGKKGFKGWFFLPYGGMQNNGSTTNAVAVNAAREFRISVCVISGDTADHNRNYVIDQVGYYSNPLDYIAAATEGYVSGDADGNDTLDSTDLTISRKAILGAVDLTDKLFFAADFNKDGVIDVCDLVRLKKELA